MNEKATQKRGFWSAFLNFLAYGGFLVVLIVVVVIGVIVSTLME